MKRLVERMADKCWQLLRAKGRQQPFAPTPSQKTRTTDDSDMEIVLVAPSYDDLTVRLREWLEEASNQLGGQVIELFGKQARSAELESILAEYRGKKTLIVFYGHGVEDSFLTSAELGTSVLSANPAHGVLCDHHMFPPNIQLLTISFCCLAASRLGPNMVLKDQRNRFIGFSGRILFPVTPIHDDLSLRRPFADMLFRVAKTGRLESEMKTYLLERYRNERRKWDILSHQSDQARLMSLCIRSHMKYLDFCRKP